MKANGYHKCAFDNTSSTWIGQFCVLRSLVFRFFSLSSLLYTRIHFSMTFYSIEVKLSGKSLLELHLDQTHNWWNRSFFSFSLSLTLPHFHVCISFSHALQCFSSAFCSMPSNEAFFEIVFVLRLITKLPKTHDTNSWSCHFRAHHSIKEKPPKIRHCHKFFFFHHIFIDFFFSCHSLFSLFFSLDIFQNDIQWIHNAFVMLFS